MRRWPSNGPLRLARRSASGGSRVNSAVVRAAIAVGVINGHSSLRPHGVFRKVRGTSTRGTGMRNTRGQAPAVLLAGLISVALTAPVLANDGVTLLSAARIHTMDPAQPQAGAMAYDRDGTIVAVGTREDLLARYPAATQIDAGNATVIPGLIDAHGHVAGLGQSQMQADL